jgi:hypothetical protein
MTAEPDQSPGSPVGEEGYVPHEHEELRVLLSRLRERKSVPLVAAELAQRPATG